MYVHLLDWSDPVLPLPRPSRRVKAASLFRSQKPVAFTLERDALLLHLDPKALDPVDTIVVLDLGK